MNDLRTQLPECPLEYEVPFIPGNHTALVIAISAADIDWQEKMLPWTLASLINNTDLIMKGVHLYIACGDRTEDRIQTALKRFDLPKSTILEATTQIVNSEFLNSTYNSVGIIDICYWAFRGQSSDKNADIKLPFGHVIKHNWGWGVADYNIHPMNITETKENWLRMDAPLHLRGLSSQRNREKLAGYLVGASHRAKFLHDANTAVYGEKYEKNIAAYFFNENGEPNWHIDTSILQYQTAEITDEFLSWLEQFGHLGADALIALYLLKTQQHAYNLRDSLMIERYPEVIASKEPNLPFYPRLCNMKSSSILGFRHAIKQLMGSQLGMKI